MLLGRVIGHATSTVKHPSLRGWRLLLVQLLNVRSEPEGDAVLAVSRYGAGVGQQVILNADGRGARDTVKDEKSPVRYFVIGIADEIAGQAAGA